MKIAGFAVWRAAVADLPAARPPVVVPAPQQGATALLADLPSELRPRDTIPSVDADTTLPADLITVEKAQEYASETVADTLQAGPNERIIIIIDGRNGTRQRIIIPAASAPAPRGKCRPSESCGSAI